MAFTQPATIITVQPQGPIISNPFFDYNQEWTTGLCDCCDDVGDCFYAHFCSCCFMSSLANSINEPAGSFFCANSLAAYRMKVRATFKIRGDSCNDACAVCWCSRCVALQMRRELRNRGFP